MLQDVTYYLIFGKPLILYLGVLTLLSLLVTASIPLMNKKGIRIVPFRWHPVCAGITILLALIHGILGILAYL
ncbi:MULTISPECIES: hypothetical protein [unclassified Methanoregula]|uniref:hypothetical protein n=1 Tax=unclassified Methanoregula TaxID=2649730 RepID=UPI0009D52326|nr:MULTISPECIES: hypothetical protein [unclassified Methanoregula]OPX64218.1 MAG: hypothetical protein A4E33_01246 [Methanoregula sp. PtaB.Bin085]OPY33658.1 MAG: hypothetical protein A4E34_01982 [Methanoregula sp. PtaU1.Bin006]